jgi:hypothetical protein
LWRERAVRDIGGRTQRRLAEDVAKLRSRRHRRQRAADQDYERGDADHEISGWI